jgi:hypothetical protein
MILRGVLALASFTGWQLSEIDEMPCDDLAEWLDHIPKDS